MKEQKQTPQDTDPMEQAYKQLDGEPAADAVSQAAKGEEPQTDEEQIEENHEERVSRYKGDVKSTDLEEAYAQLFEAVATIMRCK